MLKNISENLKTYSIFHTWQTFLLLILFFFLRALSFFLFQDIYVQGALTVVIFILFVYLYFEDPTNAWIMLIGELLLAGSGQFFTLAGLSLRSILLISFLLLTCLHQLGEEYYYAKQQIGKSALVCIIITFITIATFTVLGLTNGHGMRAIKDAIPFGYLLLFFPGYYICRKKEDNEYLIRIIIVYIIGSAIFSIFTFFLFSSGIVELQKSFYKWFRDVNFGKITPMGQGFYRIVEQSHLLITPLILIISSLLMKDEKHHHMWRLLLFLSLVVFVLNFSRSYILALAVGFIVLLFKHTWKRWFKITTYTITQALLIFIFIHFLASGGATTGLNFFEERVGSIAQPETEKSARTRLTLLPDIYKKFANRPLIGYGLGATVTIEKLQNKTTTEFDWGYFEMLIEFGIIGTMILLGVLFFLIVALIKKINHVNNYQDLHVGLLAGLISLMVINITAPALFHIYGILYIVFTAILTLKTPNIFKETIIMIYRTFHKATDNINF
ncbi:MAG: hypothetical protein BRC22_03040 [Parcubacteria group bacterium QH_9_35_7]|nr:MAG: hypothetical protein BRC22_03040 [Parcubacteria group bacterium QH_9_35_7]